MIGREVVRIFTEMRLKVDKIEEFLRDEENVEIKLNEILRAFEMRQTQTFM